jgi:hypothetical protein
MENGVVCSFSLHVKLSTKTRPGSGVVSGACESAVRAVETEAVFAIAGGVTVGVLVGVDAAGGCPELERAAAGSEVDSAPAPRGHAARYQASM